MHPDHDFISSNCFLTSNIQRFVPGVSLAPPQILHQLFTTKNEKIRAMSHGTAVSSEQYVGWVRAESRRAPFWGSLSGCRRLIYGTSVVNKARWLQAPTPVFMGFATKLVNMQELHVLRRLFIMETFANCFRFQIRHFFRLDILIRA